MNAREDRGLSEPAAPLPPPVDGISNLRSQITPVDEIQETSNDPLHDVVCPKCGYPLRGLEQPRCPECGTTWRIAELTQSRIPWVHRRRIGFWRAYWATVWMATARTDRLCEELRQPVSYLHACRFWRVTMCFASVGAALIVPVPLLPSFTRMTEYLYEEAGPFVIAATSLTMPLGVCLLLGASMLFFRPRSVSIALQNRGVALSLYASGPTALLPAAGLLLAGMAVADGIFGPHGYDWPPQLRAARLLAIAGVGILVLAVWVNCWRLAVRQASSPVRGLWVAVALPVVWSLLAGLVWIVLPLTFLHIDLICGWR